MLHKVCLSKQRLMELSLTVGLLLAVLITCRFSAFTDTCAALRSDTLRLHVQANSDSIADQTLKLKVRDAVLEQARVLFSAQSDKESAIEIAAHSLLQIQRAAEQVVQQEGSNQSVKVYLTNMYFPTTRYDTFTLPAGRYDALRVELGEHRGHNWFCVLYPGLCLPAAEQQETACYPQQQEQQLLEQSSEYEVRFAALEAVQRLAELVRTANKN